MAIDDFTVTSHEDGDLAAELADAAAHAVYDSIVLASVASGAD